jgi:hypothetical protein
MILSSETIEAFLARSAHVEPARVCISICIVRCPDNKGLFCRNIRPGASTASGCHFFSRTGWGEGVADLRRISLLKRVAFPAAMISGAVAETSSSTRSHVRRIDKRSRGCSLYAGSGEVIAAAAIDRYLWLWICETRAFSFRKRGENVEARKKREGCSREDTHQDARPAVCQSQQTCIGIFPETVCLSAPAKPPPSFASVCVCGVYGDCMCSNHRTVALHSVGCGRARPGKQRPTSTSTISNPKTGLVPHAQPRARELEIVPATAPAVPTTHRPMMDLPPIAGFEFRISF